MIRAAARAEIQPLIRAHFPFLLRVSFQLASLFMRNLHYTVFDSGTEIIAGLVVRKGKRDWEVVAVVTAPAARGKGLASELVRGLLVEAAAAGTDVIAFVRKANRGSCQLFEKTGFVPAWGWSFPYIFEEILPWGRHYRWCPPAVGNKTARTGEKD